jgi:hypothetical protein
MKRPDRTINVAMLMRPIHGKNPPTTGDTSSGSLDIPANTKGMNVKIIAIPSNTFETRELFIRSHFL